MKATTACCALMLTGLLASACSTTTRPQLLKPETTIEVMRDAYRENDSGLFLHTLSRPVLAEYSEHLIRVGWGEIRPRVGAFVDAAEIVSVEEFRAIKPDPLAPADFVWPDEDSNLMRVRLRLEGEEEDFLFEQELDPPPPDAKQARGFWIGDRYIIRTEHPSPESYLRGDSPEADRTQWRIVFPYYPFQKEGPLTRKLQEQLASEK
jgi:hypothetical protein